MRLRMVALTALALSEFGVTAAQLPWPAVVERASPAIVVIETDKSQGSGFFVRSDGTLRSTLLILLTF